MPLPDAKRIDLVVVKGETTRYVLELETETNGTVGPIDLTGYTLGCKVRRSAEDSAVLLTPTVAAIAPASGGAIELSIPANATSGLSLTHLFRAPYDIKFTAPNGEIRRWIYGDLIFHLPITD